MAALRSEDTGQPLQLPPKLSPYERAIAHEVLRELGGFGKTSGPACGSGYNGLYRSNLPPKTGESYGKDRTSNGNWWFLGACREAGEVSNLSLDIIGFRLEWSCGYALPCLRGRNFT